MHKCNLERTASWVSLLEVKQRFIIYIYIYVQPICRWTFIDLIRLRDACMFQYFLETIISIDRYSADLLSRLIISSDRYVVSLKKIDGNAFQYCVFSNSISRRNIYKKRYVKQILQNISFLATIQQFVLRDGSADVREHLFLENVRFASVNKQAANCGTKVEATELKFRHFEMG